ncbi:hypothetical protein BJ165DRAFT_1515731 [Panaeolus papilionaceus]|nr:hypothetical protein BJ165DRAFT_1515731 [Panaeolus papilionaceus]
MLHMPPLDCDNELLTHLCSDDSILKAIGPVFIQRVSRGEVPDASLCILLVGPSGSGKSSFVEALNSLRPDMPLGIAKNQLDGATQTVSIYRLQGVYYRGRPLFLVDTPGFSDPKISEMKVLNSLRMWRRRSDISNYFDTFVRVLYMHPITDTRLPKSRRRCIAMIQSFWGEWNKPRVTFVTTMWDKLTKGTDSRSKAEVRVKALARMWEKWGSTGSVRRFDNTIESAFEILEYICASQMPSNHRPASHRAVTGFGTGMLKDSGPVYELLLDRIETYQQRLLFINSELADPATPSMPELLDLLTEQQRECRTYLVKFICEMAEYLEVETPQIAANLRLELANDPIMQKFVPLNLDCNSNPRSSKPRTRRRRARERIVKTYHHSVTWITYRLRTGGFAGSIYHRHLLSFALYFVLLLHAFICIYGKPSAFLLFLVT